ncbi:hypothetical protein GGS23DRAFT_563281 [Durotheca rogersii]|uniref:uncharacterized protein n=1 Tax=Durotheca rogersii TaxID=419775 RepID=UPI0022207C06|nr:uncharacterized protein GGS23DRAFT_563281 [Durotheca rogersii]KAI5864187.1 hypothetical protein GGS23DRAFT_563281 [Durotheca rogersii]
MTETRMLRCPILGTANEYFLLEISSDGPRPLDLKLVGSESTAVFTTKLRHRRIAEYKDASSPYSDQEWEEILVATLARQQPLAGIETRADVKEDGSSVSLSFRKNILGITQRLGSIPLDEDDKTEVSPFDWCVSAIGARIKAERDLFYATARIETLHESLRDLEAQLNYFIAVKSEDEATLLVNFRDLLNRKKLKIRQQERLLAAINIDPSDLDDADDETFQDFIARVARSMKRKTGEGDESGDVGGFETMDFTGYSEGHAGSSTEEDGTPSATSTDRDAEEPAQLPASSRSNRPPPPGASFLPPMPTPDQYFTRFFQRAGYGPPPPPPSDLPFSKRAKTGASAESTGNETASSGN